MEVVKTHFSTTLAKQNQPHTLSMHVEFLRRTESGPATFKVDNIKLGRQTSTVHVHLSQGGRDEVVAYVTNTNIDKEEGLTFDTQYTMTPPPPPVDLAKLEKNEDPNWDMEGQVPFHKFRKASQKLIWCFPKHGHVKRSIADEWICFRDGQNFTQTSLGFAADMFPQIVEFWRDKSSGPFWYPTLLLNLDVKKALPEEGVKWLQVRVETKQIKNGRMDLEVHVYDAGGDLVALSHHVTFVLSAERNMAARSKPGANL